MSDAGGTEETTDYSKMKVNDLKKILKNRGLPMSGTKQELVERLQTAESTNEDLLDGSEVGDDLVEDEDLERELDDSSLIGDDTVIEKPEEKKETPEKGASNEVTKEVASSSPSKTAAVSESGNIAGEEKPTNGAVCEEPQVPNTTQQKRTISLKGESSAATEATKKKLRAERFGAGAQNVPKDVLTKRAERFAINSTTTSTAVSNNKVPPSEALKKRAERFGILSPAEIKKQHLEKLQKRKLRFSSSTPSVTPTSTVVTTTPASTAPLPSDVKPTLLSVEERKKLRAQRFKLN